MPIHIAGAVLPAVPWATNVSHRKAPGAISAMAFIVRPVNPSVGCISGAEFSAIESLLEVNGRDERGPALPIVNARYAETKRKFLIAEISVLYAFWLMPRIKNFDRPLQGSLGDCVMLSAERSSI